MRIGGWKNAKAGTHKLVRYVTHNGTKTAVANYKLTIVDKKIQLFSEKDEDMSEQVRSIEFKKGNVLLMWIKPSRLGLLYSIESFD
mgnify:FL=1